MHSNEKAILAGGSRTEKWEKQMTARNSRLTTGFFWIVLLGWLMSSSQAVLAQGDSIPNRNYYQGFFKFYDAEYRDAGRIFNRAAGRSMRFGQSRFLDSVCAWTMMGECHFHVGNYEEAITYYEQALALYLDYVANDWQARLQMPPAIVERNGAIQAAQITWGVSKRQFRIPTIPNSIGFIFGQVGGIDRALQQGGVAVDPKVRSVDVAEIMRCTAVALQRRRWIKGATCKYDPFSAKLLDGLAAYGGGDGTLVGSWNGVLLGIAQASMGRGDAAQNKLAASLQFGGNMDHNLTPIALLELSDLRLSNGDNAGAANLALEASYSAAIFDQFDVVAEAMKLGTRAHLIDNRSVFPPLEAVILWSNRGRNEARLLEAVSTVRLADCLSEMGATELCSKALVQSGRLLSRADLPLTPERGRAGYLSAVVKYINGDYSGGREDLTAALAQFSKGSRWLYQLQLAEKLVVNGTVTERQADLLYGALLRDPYANEWKMAPIETMSFMASNHLGALERWFEIIVSRREFDRALQVSELLKRHRFFSSLPMGGRLLAFRWMMESPTKIMSKEGLAHRAEFDARFAAYQPLSKRAEQIRQELLKMPLKPADDSDDLKKQTDLFVELHKISLQQESMLASVALRRQASAMNFPPVVDSSQTADRIQPDEIALVTVNAGTTMYLFGHSKKGTALLGAFPARRMATSIAKLNRELLILEKQVNVDDLAKDKKWKDAADDLTANLLGGITAAQWSGVKRLVIVPDGASWYLPWEVLRIGPDEANKKMLAQMAEIRYAPTLGLALANELPYHRITRSAVFTGKLSGKADEDQAKLAAEAMLADLPSLSIYERRAAIPSNLLGSVADRFLVWTQIERASRGGNSAIYATAPIQLDRERNGSNLASWLSLPYRNADQVLMPGFVSDGGGGKSKSGGNDLFLTTTAMLGSGVRTIGISRWNTGGQNALDLSREFVKQNQDESAVTAWNKTIQSASTMAVDLAKEPRFKPSANAPQLTAEHPLFWSGMIIVDMRAERPQNPNPPVVNNPDAQNPNPDAQNPNGGNAKDMDGEKDDDAEKEADGKAGDGKEADGKEADGKEADGKEADGKEADGKEADGKEADGKEADGKAGDKKADGKSESGNKE